MIEHHHVTAIGPTACAALGIPIPPTATDAGLPRDSLPAGLFQAQRLLILVLDSWGELNWRQAADHTPYLSALDARHRTGTLLATLPSITPVNFTAIGTGTHLETHGVSARTEQPSVQTVFEAATAAGRTSSVVGPADSSSVLILGPTATHCLVAQTKRHSNAEVALMLATHLHEHRPDLVLAQWLDLDSVGHEHGPFSPEHLATYRSTDALLRHFIPFAQRLGYWILLTADHGMHDGEDGSPDRGTHGSDDPYDTIVPLWIIPPAD